MAGASLGVLLILPSVAGAQTEPKKSLIVTGKKPKASQLPELDPSAVGSAAVLLLGGTLVALGRQRRGESA